MTDPTPHEIFELGDFALDCGVTLPNAQIAYATYGTAQRRARQCHRLSDLVRRHPSRPRMADRRRQAARHDEVFRRRAEHVRATGCPPRRRTRRRPYDRGRFPGDHHPGQCPRAAPAADRAVRRAADPARDRRLDGRLPGLSMGRSPIPTSSSGSRPAAARRACSPHCYVFLDGRQGGARWPTRPMRAATTSSPPDAGLRALGRVWAGWALSQQFYRDELSTGGWASTTSRRFLVDFWEAFWLKLRRQRPPEPAPHLADRRHRRRRPATTATSSARSARSAPRPC